MKLIKYSPPSSVQYPWNC